MIAHPRPACMAAVNADIEHAAARSASSRTRNADLPPTPGTPSDGRGAAAMTARPVAVEPVNDTMSTRGSPDSIAPTSWSLDVTMLSTPGGTSVYRATSSPENRGTPRGIGRRFQNHRVARRQRRADLGQVDLVREIPRRDRTDNAYRFPNDGPPGADSHRGCDSRSLRHEYDSVRSAKYPRSDTGPSR